MTNTINSFKSLFSKIQKYKCVVIEYVVALYFLLCCVQICVLPDIINGLYDFLHDFMYFFYIPLGLKILLDILESKKLPILFFILFAIGITINYFSNIREIYFLLVIIPAVRGCNIKETISKCMIAIGSFYFLMIFLSLMFWSFS